MCLFIPRFVVVQLYFSCCGQSSHSLQCCSFLLPWAVEPFSAVLQFSPAVGSRAILCSVAVFSCRGQSSHSLQCCSFLLLWAVEPFSAVLQFSPAVGSRAILCSVAVFSCCGQSSHSLQCCSFLLLWAVELLLRLVQLSFVEASQRDNIEVNLKSHKIERTESLTKITII